MAEIGQQRNSATIPDIKVRVMNIVSNSELFVNRRFTKSSNRPRLSLGELVTIHELRPKDKEDRSEETAASFLRGPKAEGLECESRFLVHCWYWSIIEPRVGDADTQQRRIERTGVVLKIFRSLFLS